MKISFSLYIGTVFHFSKYCSNCIVITHLFQLNKTEFQFTRNIWTLSKVQDWWMSLCTCCNKGYAIHLTKMSRFLFVTLFEGNIWAPWNFNVEITMVTISLRAYFSFWHCCHEKEYTKQNIQQERSSKRMK